MTTGTSGPKNPRTLGEIMGVPMCLRPYTGDFISFPRGRGQRRIEGMAVRAQETCPECGRTMVNIYQKGNEWKCKKCLDREEKTE